MDPKDNALKGKHFSRLHEKIQNKYSEIQRRLEKSKSVESLSTVSSDLSFTDLKYASTFDLTEAEDEFGDQNKGNDMLIHRIIVEDINNQNATLEEVKFKEASVSQLDSEYTFNDGYLFSSPKEMKLSNGNRNLASSLELLNETEKGSDDNVTPTTPPPRISLRNKIGSRITAVKEKRREEKEKYSKDKKKETKDTGTGLEKLILSNAITNESRFSKRLKLATLTIALIDVTGLDIIQNGGEEKPRNLHCRFKLGTDKCKSKSVKSAASEVKWQELFNFNMYEENMLEITLWDKDIFIGRHVIDLANMDKEKTHRLNINLEGEMPNAKLFLLLTISGTSIDNNIYDLGDYQESQKRLEAIWYQLDNLSEVGWLSIIVYGAKGLAGQDCYCILKIGNERLQTYTDYKTNEPNWMKAFTFTINDITRLLEVIVYDERKNEEIGCVSIPLLQIDNGHKAWYALKDISQRYRAKGNNPRILLEMRISFNPIKASLRVLKPREIDYLEVEEKFDRRLFTRNWTRTKAIINWILKVYRVTKTSFQWESRKVNTIALIIWLIFHWFYKAWMLPLLLLIPFFYYSPEDYNFFEDFMHYRKRKKEDDSGKIEKEEKTSIRQKIHSLQELIQNIQNFLGKIANLGESVKNLFNFSVPFLSLFAILCLLGISFIMYLIPVNYLLMAWGIRKYTKKILQPNRIPHNEILDLLSRVPNDEILLNCEELSLEAKEEKL
ncbi:multiple C2 and transmembrane domain-containing protein-like [Achroia grisella]|uniref:multiple C2 and transmembrane domain-containing protein-like n=1 Tax=Achroia grisella TaxID=688607 RepID=UPI0027D26F44|nr:multiple C2 and transmembrane domain-containing protein-like [Achroia grisella]